MSKNIGFNGRQTIFKEMFVGTLIYACVLGFLDDYSDIVSAKSFSTIFMASVVLQCLAILAFRLKTNIIDLLKQRQQILYKILMFFSVWLVMFLSKFVFVWVVDSIFGENININGFFGILIVIASVTVIHKSADKLFIKLGK